MKKRKKRRNSTLGAVTKQDFVGIASVLCETKASASTVDGISRYFARQNARFAADRFEHAARCGRK